MARKVAKPALPSPPMRVAPEHWPANCQEERSVAELVPYANNARTHSATQVRQIAGLIGRYGWTSRPLVDETGMLLAGHGRILAAQLLKIKVVPVMVARGWSEAQKRAYILADNKVAENAGWDKDKLAEELAALADDLPALDLNFAGLGFTDAELGRLLPELEREGFTDADADQSAAGGDGAVVSRPGDIWLLGDHRLMCGDSTLADHVEALLGVNRPHLMVTDPPYGVEYDPEWRVEEQERGTFHQGGDGSKNAIGIVANDHRADWSDAWRLFPGEVAYVWSAPGPAQFTSAASLEACGFQVRQQIIWAKRHFAIGRGHYHYQHEPCWYAVRKGGTGHWQGARDQSTVWSDIAANNGFVKVEESTGHGTQKPIECMKRPIKNNSKPGDYVYEPFSGSGTTIIAGEQLSRRVLAMELMPEYVDIAVKRWEGFTKKTAILAAGEKGRAAVAAERGIALAA